MTAHLRAAPRFSVNKLAEYMSAGVTRRRALIIDQITQPTVKMVGYAHARLALTRLMRNANRRPKDWIDAASVFRDRAATSVDSFDAKCLHLSAQALEAFAQYSDTLKPRGVIAVACPRRQTFIQLGGVRVTTSADVALIEIATERRIGSVKMHMSKMVSLTHDGLESVSVLLHETLIRSGDDPKRALCFAVDAFSGRVAVAPRAVKARLRALEHACEEIAHSWPALYEAQLAKATDRRSR